MKQSKNKLVKGEAEDIKMYDLAVELLEKNKDLVGERSVVVSVILAQSGKMYTGINVSWWHSFCAEPVAFGNARLNGEREFKKIIAVKLHKNDLKIRVVSSCGICREMFHYMDRSIKFINEVNGELKSYSLEEMLPF